MTATHIIRVSSNCDTVTIARATARDRRLSFQARGMLLALLAMGDGAETSIDALIDESPAGRDAVYGTLAELRTAGYVDRYAERGPSGKITRWVTWVREVTQEDSPEVATPLTAGPLTAGPLTAKPDVAGYSVTHSPTAPYLAKPEVVSARPAKSPPTRDVLIPPPVQPETRGTSDDVPPGGQTRDETWAPFHAVTAEDLTGDPNGWRDKRNGGVKAVYGQLAGKFGPPCRDDVAAAIALWRRFVEAKKAATFRETGEPLWSAVTPRNVVEVAGRWVKDSAPVLPPVPTDTRPPIGAVLGPLGLSTSNPAKWPPHVLSAYADVAAQWGYVPAEAAR